jgi:hypothetical protein
VIRHDDTTASTTTAVVTMRANATMGIVTEPFRITVSATVVSRAKDMLSAMAKVHRSARPSVGNSLTTANPGQKSTNANTISTRAGDPDGRYCMAISVIQPELANTPSREKIVRSPLEKNW